MYLGDQSHTSKCDNQTPCSCGHKSSSSTLTYILYVIIRVRIFIHLHIFLRVCSSMGVKNVEDLFSRKYTEKSFQCI